MLQTGLILNMIKRLGHKDGLTTIIPITSDKLVYKGVDWIEISKLSSIKSYFKDFENNKLVLTLNDEINKNKHEIKVQIIKTIIKNHSIGC